MKRSVHPELLDQLAPHDPRALHSRRDLCRVNRWMGNPGILARHWRMHCDGRPVKSVVELGAGDGAYLLRVASKLKRKWPGVEAVLVDRQNLASEKMKREFDRIGWRANFVQADIFDWLVRPGTGQADVMIANLFLHHFRDEALGAMFQHLSRRTSLFLACEPSRSTFSLLACKLLWLIGCNHVSRHDAEISVRAAFKNHELSALWPDHSGWHLEEGEEGPFSHYFCAQRTEIRTNDAGRSPIKKSI